MNEAMSRRPATERLYLRLKPLALSAADGERLGAESELLARFSASRPTFRQAMALLEGEQLVRIRRGNGGGYYAARPTAATALHAIAGYCRSLDLPREEVIAAWIPVRVETVRLAARNRDAAGRARLAAFVAELGRGDTRQFARTVRRFNALLALLAGNRMLSLFYEILHESGNRIDQQDFYRRRPERISAYAGQMLLLAEAIAAGDETGAERASRACIDYNLAWADQDRRLRETGRRPTA